MSPRRLLLLVALSLSAMSGRAMADETTAEESPAAFTPQLPNRSLFEKGEFVYEQNCVVCHGPKGDGQGELASQLSPKPRKFSAGTFKYRSTPWGKLPTNSDLARTIREGRSGTAMGMFSNLRADEVEALVEYVKSFSRKWRKAENYAPPVTIPDLPAWFANAEERVRHAESGNRIFAATCASCHGNDGSGTGPAAAGLKDDWGEPALPADLRQPHLRSGPDLQDVYRVLVTGLNGTPMQSFAELLDEQQRWDLVAFVASLRDRAESEAK